jgi:poly-gamma-glutamate capsule biosynthesis protein CapA/YwtB (metallophosphatase superfamily)
MKIALLGDIYLSDGWAGPNGNGADAGLFEHVKRKIGPEALLIGNVEFAIADGRNPRELRPYKWATLCSSSAVAGHLSPLAVAILANNHAGDAGLGGLEDTVANLQGIGVRSAGYGKTLDHALEPCIIEREGKKIGLVALCCLTTNSESIATHSDPGVAPISVQTLRRAIARARQQTDAVIVFVHWGCEQTPYPVPDQVRLGRLAIDAGASAVVGCHAHVIQTYERYKGCWIFHGIGNFFFDPVDAKSFEDGQLVTDVRIEHEVKNRESLVPVFELRGQSLELADLFLTSWKDRQPPTVKELSEAAVNLRKINSRLRRWAWFHGRKLARTSEPQFKCKLRNGIVAYHYGDSPIAADWTFKHLIMRALKKALRIAASLHKKLQQSWQIAR